MKKFLHHEIPKLKRIDSENGRLYETSTGQRYPSVTSVVGLLNAKHIQEWRDRVGHEEANKISNRASKRGTAIHSLCEEYLKTGTANSNIFQKEMFDSIQPLLDRIDNIHCLETPLFSHRLQIAGTVDCIAEFDGQLHIIDFKTSSRVKYRDSIHNYFIQTSAYSYMFWELTGIPVNRLLIIMGVDNHPCLLFQEKTKYWLPKFIELRENYRLIKSI